MDESKLIARILDGHTDDYGYFIERYGDSVASLVVRRRARRPGRAPSAKAAQRGAPHRQWRRGGCHVCNGGATARPS